VADAGKAGIGGGNFSGPQQVPGVSAAGLDESGLAGNYGLYTVADVELREHAVDVCLDGRLSTGVADVPGTAMTR
jgi:hypothetical protein